MSIKWHQPVAGHIAGADGSCTPVLIHYKKECDDTSSDYVVTEPSVLSIVDGTEAVIDPATHNGGGELIQGSCDKTEQGQVPVYICEMVDNETGWDVRWWYGDDALPATPLGVDKPAVWVRDDTVDVSEAFDLGDSGASTDAAYSERVIGFKSGAENELSNADAPGYNATVHGALASQSIREGWVRVPVTQEEVWISVDQFYNSTGLAFIGYTSEDMSQISPWAKGISYTGANEVAKLGGFEALSLSRERAVHSTEDYWYVFVQGVVSNVIGPSDSRIVYSPTGTTGDSFVPIPESEVFAGLHVLKQTVKLVDEDYEIQDGESFAPCDEIDVSDAFYSFDTPEYVDTKLLCETDPQAIGGGTYSYWHWASEGGNAADSSHGVDGSVNTVATVWPTGPGSHIVGAADGTVNKAYAGHVSDVTARGWVMGADPTLTWGDNSSTPDQSMFEGKVSVSCGTVQFRSKNSISNESGGVWVAESGGGYALDVDVQGTEGASSLNPGDQYIYGDIRPTGVYDVAFCLYDHTGPGTITFEVSLDGGETWGDVEADLFGIADPDVAPCCFLAGIEADGTVRNVETGEALDIADKKYSWHMGATSAAPAPVAAESNCCDANCYQIASAPNGLPDGEYKRRHDGVWFGPSGAKLNQANSDFADDLIGTQHSTHIDCVQKSVSGPVVDHTKLPYIATKTTFEPYNQMDGKASTTIWLRSQFLDEGDTTAPHSKFIEKADGRPYYNGDSVESSVAGMDIANGGNEGELTRKRALLILPSTFHGDVTKPVTGLKLVDVDATGTVTGASFWLSIDSEGYSLDRDSMHEAFNANGSYHVDPQQLGKHVYAEAYLEDQGGTGGFMPRFEITYDNAGVSTTVVETLNKYMGTVETPPSQGVQTGQERLTYNGATGAWADAGGAIIPQAKVDLYRKLQKISETSPPILGDLFVDSIAGKAITQNLSGGNGDYVDVSYDMGHTWQALADFDITDHSQELLLMVRDSDGLESGVLGWGINIYQDNTEWMIETASAAAHATSHSGVGGWHTNNRGASWAAPTQVNKKDTGGGNAYGPDWYAGLFGYNNDAGGNTEAWIQYLPIAGKASTIGRPLCVVAKFKNNGQGQAGDTLSVPVARVTDIDGVVLYSGPFDLTTDHAALTTGGDTSSEWDDWKQSGTWVSNGKDVTLRISMAHTGTPDGTSNWYGIRDVRFVMDPQYGNPVAGSYIKRENAALIRWNAKNGSIITEPFTVSEDGVIQPSFDFTKGGAFGAGDSLTIMYRKNGGAWTLMHEQDDEWEVAGKRYLSPFVYHEGIEVQKGDTIEYEIAVDWDEPSGKWIRMSSARTKTRLLVD